MIALRLIWLTARSWNKRLPDPLADCLTRQRIWPNDLDTAFHLNNGRFLTLMDLGRLDWWIKQGLMKPAIKHRWRPVVGAATIRYRRSLRLFQPFQFRTKLVYWDEKWLYFEEMIEDLAGEVQAKAHISKQVRAPGGFVPPAEVLALAGWSQPSPPKPKSIEIWLEWLGSLKNGD